MVLQDPFVVDIGTDHGLLPVYLLCSGKSHEAYAVDKSPKALQQAKKNILSIFNSSPLSSYSK